MKEVILEDLNHPIVVVKGNNEAGKSTFFEFLKTMFFGFSPANREGHPYTPWSGEGILQGSVSYVLDSGQSQTVSRSLRSRPAGAIVEDGDSRDLGNKGLPQCGHLGRDLYEAVFALTLSEMAAIAEKPWEEIQERLLGTMGIDTFRLTSEVRAELEDEANSLWRPTRKGKPLAKELEARISELGKAASLARDRDEEVRRLTVEMSATRAAIEALERELADLGSRQKWLDKILPIRQRLAEIESQRQIARNPSDFDRFPEDPSASREQLEREALELTESLARRELQIATSKGKQAALTDADRTLLQLEGEIREWDDQAGEARLQQKRADELRFTLEQGWTEFGEIAGRLFSKPLDARQLEVLRRLPTATVRQAYNRYDTARTNFRSAQLNGEGATLGSPVLALAFPLTVAAAGLALTPVALLGMQGTLQVTLALLGVLLAIGGLAYGAHQWAQQRRTRENFGAKIETARMAAEEARLGLVEPLAELGLPGALSADPEDFVVTDLEELKRRLHGLDRTGEDLEGLSAAVARFDEAFGQWCESHQLVKRSNARILLEELQKECQSARERKTTAQEAAERIRSDEDMRTQDLEKKQRLEAELEDLIQRVSAFGDGNWELGLGKLKARRDAWRNVALYELKLNKDFPDWEEFSKESLQLERDGRYPVATEELREETVLAVEEKGKELGDLRERLGSLRSEREGLRKQESSAQIEGEIASLRDRLDEIFVERDRWALLARVVAIAEKQFRDKHQPDVLKQASAFLGVITDGRYVKIDYNEETKGLGVLGADSLEVWKVDAPLSRGIRDQIYLCLRLALVEHLDAGVETLPVFLDEVLVNWDTRRRKNGYALLKEFTKARQVLLFTCHQWLADELALELDPRLVSLG